MQDLIFHPVALDKGRFKRMTSFLVTVATCQPSCPAVANDYQDLYYYFCLTVGHLVSLYIPILHHCDQNVAEESSASRATDLPAFVS